MINNIILADILVRDQNGLEESLKNVLEILLFTELQNQFSHTLYAGRQIRDDLHYYYLQRGAALLRKYQEYFKIQLLSIVSQNCKTKAQITRSLRGGGCGTSVATIRPEETQKEILEPKKPEKFVANLELQLKRIINKAHLAKDEGQQEEILIAIQWFRFMKIHLNNLCQDASSVYDLIYTQFPELIRSAITLTRISGFLLLQILQILNDLARILFSYFMTNKVRFFTTKYKENILILLNDLKMQVDIESANLWIVGIEYEMELIRAVIENAPSDSKQGQKLLLSFMGGLAKSVLAMSPSQDLIESLIAGAAFLHKVYQIKNKRKKYEIYYFFETLKWQIISLLEQHKTTVSKIQQLITKAYQTHIANSTDWMLNFCWINFICYIIQYRPSIQKQNLNLPQWQEMIASQLIKQVSCERNYARAVLYDQNNEQLQSNHMKTLKNLGIIQFSQLIYYLLDNLQYSAKKGLIIKSELQNTFRQPKDYLLDFLCENDDLQESDELKHQVDELISFIHDFQLSVFQFISEYSGLPYKESQSQKTYYINLSNIQETSRELIETVNQTFQKIYQNQNSLFNITQRLELIINSMVPQAESVGELQNILLIDLHSLQNQDLKNCCEQVKKIENEKLNCIQILIIFTLQFDYMNNKNIKTQTQQQFEQINNFLELLEAYITQVMSFVQKISGFRSNYLNRYQKFQTLYLFQNYNFGIIEQAFVSILNQNIIGEKIKNICQFQEKLFTDQELFFNLVQYHLFCYQIDDLLNLIHSQQVKFDSFSFYLKQNLCIKQIDNKRLNGNDQIQEILTSAYDTISFLINRAKTTEDSQEQDNDGIISSLKTAIFKLTNLKIIKNNEKISPLILKINFLTKKIAHLPQISQVQEVLDPFFNEQLFPDVLKTDIYKQYSIQRQDTLNQNTIIQTISTQIVESLNSTFFSYSELLKQAIEKCTNIKRVASENLELYVQAWEVEKQSLKHRENFQEIHQYIVSVQRSLTADIQFIYQIDFCISDFQLKSQQDYLQASNQIDLFMQFFEQTKIGTQTFEKGKKINLSSNIFQKAIDFVENFEYKVRECLIVNLFIIQAAQLEPNVISFCQQILMYIWTYEKDERVRKLLKNKELVELQKQLFSNNLKSSAHRLQQELKERLENMSNLEQKIKLEGNIEQREKMQQQLIDDHSQFEEFLENINDMTSKLDINLAFLKEIKKDLQEIKQQIEKLQETIKDLGDDIRKLKGKTFIELLEIRKKKVLDFKKYRDLNSIYIPLHVQEWDPTVGKIIFDEREKVKTLLVDNNIDNGEVNQFLIQKDKDVMLIKGLAGSGKSRAAAKIEEFLLEKQSTWIPIYVSLPSLKEPRFNLIDQALMSEYYQFDKMQIKELKESLSKQQIRLILILDSYDEMQQQCIQSNLFQTNRFSQDLLGEDKVNSKDIYKIIITTRSEILNSPSYQTWFYGESIKSLKEIELKGFDDTQKANYLQQYAMLSVKKEIFEIYEFVKQATSKQFDLNEFTHLWQNLQINLLERNIFSNEEGRFLLTEYQADILIKNLQSENSLKNISDEQKKNLKKRLIQLWSASKFQQLIRLINIQNILTTPFMMEIVVQVLPTMIQKFSDISVIKQSFLENFSLLKEQDLQQKQLIQVYNEQQKQIFLQQIKVQKFGKGFSINIPKLTQETWEKLEQINFFADFSIERDIQVNHLYPLEDMNIIVRALQIKTLTVFDFYSEFTNYYHQRSIAKLKSQGKIMNYEGFYIDLFNFSQSLALDMTINQITQTKYEQKGQLHLNHTKTHISEDDKWKEVYFDDFQDGAYKKLIRSCILLTLKGNNYSFSHKSIQEFYVAAYLISLLKEIEIFINSKVIEKDLFNQEKFNIFSDIFKGVLFLIKDKLKLMKGLKSNLIKIIKLTQSSNTFVRAASNCVYLLNYNNDNLINEQLNNIKITNTSLHGMSLYGANLENSSFENVNISSCNLNCTNLKNVNWINIGCNELPKLMGHTDNVRSVIFSPDGKLLASCSDDKTIKLWDVMSGQEILLLEGHQQSVMSVAFSPDGKILASGSGDKSIRLWDVKSGKRLKTFDGHTNYVRSVVFSPDGKVLASGSGDKTIKLWDVDTGKELSILTGHTGYIWLVDFSPNGLLLASGSQDKTIKIWDAKKGKEISTFHGHSETVMSVSFSPDGQILASSSGDKTIILWDLKSEKQIKILEGHTSYVRSVHFSPDGNILASGSGDNTIRLWDAKAGKELYLLEGHTGYVWSVSFSPDGQILTSGSDDKTIRLWDVKAGKQLSLQEGHSGYVSSVAFSPDGLILASGSDDKSIRLWDINAGKMLSLLEGHTENIMSVTFSPDGQTLASGSGDNTVRLWDVKAEKLLAILKGHSDYVRAVQFSPEGNILASGSGDKSIRFWNMKTFQELLLLEGHSGHLWSVSFFPDGQILASGSSDNTIRLWEVKTGKQLLQLGDHTETVMSVAFSPDGMTLASGSGDNTIRLWDVQTGKEKSVLEGHTGYVWTVAFSPDGLMLASGSGDTTIRLWDVKTEDELFLLTGHTEDVRQVAFSPDGLILSSCSGDKTIRLWDLKVGKQLLLLKQTMCNDQINEQDLPVLNTQLLNNFTMTNISSNENRNSLYPVIQEQEQQIIQQPEWKEIRCFQIFSQRKKFLTNDSEISGAKIVSQHQIDLLQLFNQSDMTND